MLVVRGLLLVAWLVAGCGASPSSGASGASRPATAAPASDDATSVGEPDGSGELTMAVVEAHMGPIRQRVRACAAVTSYEGKVTARVTIAPSGEASAVIEHGAGKPEIDGCIVDAVGKTVFPASQRGQRFAYSFTF